ncbi:UPF0728 protein C10orf53 homolog [Cylas formicarius]|uniref:UPF0728 protein C10orf53 homolog n=1 Tax=Cylas formicarius TaxID=197179 RepID=UPI002958984C|nr:UPF0728 protein C10orf53 homolog [Cylas formicarius]
MPQVVVKYGPYSAGGIIQHRIQKIFGLLKALEALGYEIKSVPSDELNRLSVAMCNIEIFKCNITNLKFNMLCQDDILCRRIVKAVEEASSRIYNSLPT